jgi:hypothetical protein
MISPMRALTLCLLLLACGGSKEPPKDGTTVTKTDVPATPPPTTTEEPKKEEPRKEEPKKKKPAKEVIEGNTFMFSLADSPDAKKLVDESCKKAKKPEDCAKEAETSAAGEGIRFEGGAWISFGTEKGKEVVYNKVKYKIASESDDKLTLTPDGKDEGKKPMKALPKEMVIEVVDESTVAMSDPKKGRLVFKKK